ncbi:hypothetical protein D3C85_716040 [compost metagenome]
MQYTLVDAPRAILLQTDKETYPTHNVLVCLNCFWPQKFYALPSIFAIWLQFRSDCISFLLYIFFQWSHAFAHSSHFFKALSYKVTEFLRFILLI